MYVHTRSRSYGGTLFFLGGFLLVPLIALGGEANVRNDISVSAGTGGNHAPGGIITEGNAKSQVQVKTVIDGEVVTDIATSSQTDRGENRVNEFVIEELFQHPERDVRVESAVRVRTEGGGDTEELTETESREEQEAFMNTETTTKGKSTFSIRSWVTNMIAYVFGIFR